MTFTATSYVVIPDESVKRNQINSVTKTPSLKLNKIIAFQEKDAPFTVVDADDTFLTRNIWMNVAL